MHGDLTLYVAGADQSAYRKYLCEHILRNEAIPVLDRFKALSKASRDVYLHALSSRCSERMSEATRTIAEDLVDLVWKCPPVLGELLDVMTHDYSTYHHACNVSVYAMLLAVEFLQAGREVLVEIAQGALLHDVGKKHVSTELLNKVGPLDPSEVDLIKLHPQAGFEFLAKTNSLSWGTLMMVLQHHERCDGNGYPMELAARDIHPWAQLCAVVDVFDALVSQRAYRGGFRAADALEYLDLQSGRGFNEEMVRCFASIVNQNR